MTKDNPDIRRALRALESAAGDDAHPGIETLEAYVEGRLSPAERAEVDRRAARSHIVAEDLADLQAMHAAITTRPVASRDIRWRRVAVAAGIAATLVMGVWLTTRRAPAPDAAPGAVRARLTPEEQQLVSAAVSAGRLTLPARVAALITVEGTLLGGQGTGVSFGPLTPVGTAVRSARPRFTWTDAGADGYTVAVFDANFTEVARSPRVTGTSWTPEIELPQADMYVWQVTAHRAAAAAEIAPRPPQPEARFSVLDAATLARVEAFEQRLAGDSLALGILLADAGLVADARVHLARAAATPATADAARRLLASLDEPATAR